MKLILVGASVHLLVALLVLLLTGLLTGCGDGKTWEQRNAEWEAKRDAETRLLYSGWLKAHGVTNLTFAEWKALRSADLLPSQPKPKEGMSASEAAAFGYILGNSKR